MAELREPQSQPLSRWQRLVLPGGLVESANAGRSPRDWVVDVVMFAASLGLGSVVLAGNWDMHPSPTRPLDILGGLVACLALWRRREHPVAVAVLAIALSSVCSLAAGAALAAGFNAAMRARPRAVAVLLGLSLAANAMFSVIFVKDATVDWTGAGIGTLLTIVAFSLGMLARAQRELLLSMRRETRRLQDGELLRTEQAREAERRRIAREMHDVLAHRISLVSLHAGALEYRTDATPDEVVRAAGVIRASAHAALEELRDVIGVLRDGAAGATAPPQPTLAQLPALVEESRAAGTPVTLDVGLPAQTPISDTLGRTVYRVVQEGLTNARKHAPAAAVRVEVAVRDDTIVARVVSRRAVGIATANGTPGSGTGLAGLAERVALAGGRLEHGVDAGGDFVIHVTLPLAP
jgi:signal transduction histidine kinase